MWVSITLKSRTDLSIPRDRTPFWKINWKPSMISKNNSKHHSAQKLDFQNKILKITIKNHSIMTNGHTSMGKVSINIKTWEETFLTTNTSTKGTKEISPSSQISREEVEYHQQELINQIFHSIMMTVPSKSTWTLAIRRESSQPDLTQTHRRQLLCSSTLTSWTRNIKEH